MTDNNRKVNNDSSNQNSTSGGSPWDEPLNLPEEKKKPEVVGTLEPTEKDETVKEKKPVPFNIPQGVGEEKVGKKEPAEKFIEKAEKSNKQQFPPPSVSSAIESKVDPAGRPIDEGSGTDMTKKLPLKPLKTQEPTPPRKPEISPPPKPVSDNKNTEIVPPVPKSEELPPLPPPPSPPLKPKEGFFARFKKKSKSKSPKVLAKPKLPPPPPPPKPVPKPKPPKPKGPKKPLFFKQSGFLVTFVIIIFLSLGVYLTEVGLIAIGLEKVYGLVGLESLWGGLSKNPERALSSAAQKAQTNLDFKIEGKITLTVDKTVESNITSPLVVLPIIFVAKKDENISAHIMAVRSQYDYYDYDTDYDYYEDSTTTQDFETDSDSSSDSSSGYIDQESKPGYQTEESTIKEIQADFDGYSSGDGTSMDFVIDKLVGQPSTISLISNQKELYVKTSNDIEYNQNAQSSKWLQYNVSKSEQPNALYDFYGIKFDKGFSIIGRRTANEKINLMRCYKYQVDNLEIGDSLVDFGIESSMVQRISGNVWIGVADHLIHKIDLTIIPSISASVSRIDVEAVFIDYGVENSLVVPSLNDKVIISGSSEPKVSDVTSIGEDSVELRDNQRKSDLGNIKTALKQYKNNNGSYPKSFDWRNVNDVLSSKLVPEYISNLPSDPKSADGWWYGYKSNGSTFTLSARLENTADTEITKIGDKYLHYVYNGN